MSLISQLIMKRCIYVNDIPQIKNSRNGSNESEQTLNSNLKIKNKIKINKLTL